MTEETETTDLLPRQTQALTYSMPSMREWEIMRQHADVFVRSGLLPRAVNTPEKALAIMLKGRELNVPPWTALTKIHVITGTPTVSPALMLAMVRRSEKLESFEIVERTAEQCTIKGKRIGEPMHTETFTIEEASRLTTKQYGKEIPLTEKRNWQEQPEVMLMWRCVSRFCRLIFGDIIDLYTHEEINPDLRFDDMGEIVEADQVEDYPSDFEQAHPDLQREMDIEDEMMGADLLPAEIEAFADGPHWTVEQNWNKFWRWCKDDLGLTREQVHEALDVASVKDYTDTKEKAVAILRAFAATPPEDRASVTVSYVSDAGLVPCPATIKQGVDILNKEYNTLFSPAEVRARLNQEGYAKSPLPWYPNTPYKWSQLREVFDKMANDQPQFKDV